MNGLCKINEMVSFNDFDEYCKKYDIVGKNETGVLGFISLVEYEEIVIIRSLFNLYDRYELKEYFKDDINGLLGSLYDIDDIYQLKDEIREIMEVSKDNE